MAAITNTTVSGVIGSLSCNEQTLGSSDTITITSAKQLMVVRNATGGSVSLLIDGDGGTSVSINGLGSVSVSGGYTITIPAGESKAVVLSTISYFTQGVVTLSGASGAKIQIFNL